ncbi:hypothetical protein E1281_16400 [Actinomadura sp. KC345]|uniref:hypothetical protein n=1 Tax=Actinomadura sp. KC345 TaxID=2530371 RepID=UPI001046F6A1|nr:hypothetical protein [Actinomadura sp. KC345]TDC54316.1 hypothetical protein E1281_16400 [Actinomadura sp. KC345]
MSQDLPAVIADELRRSGQTRATYHSHDERDRLRAAGRQAGRSLDRPVRTFDTAARHPRCDADQCGTVLIALTDWGSANPLEDRLARSRANNAVDRALNN